MFGPINISCKTKYPSVLCATIPLTTEEEEEFGRQKVTPNPSFKQKGWGVGGAVLHST